MTISGPDFVALQVLDLESAATFYETHLGLTRTPTSPPGAVVFATKPVAFAVREPLPGVDLTSEGAKPGLGIALWLASDDAEALHDRLVAADVLISVAPFDGPFGWTFTFIDANGYAITIHD